MDAASTPIVSTTMALPRRSRLIGADSAGLASSTRRLSSGSGTTLRMYRPTGATSRPTMNGMRKPQDCTSALVSKVVRPVPSRAAISELIA